MYICSQNLLSVSLRVNILLQSGNFNGNRSVPCKLMSYSEYSVIKSDVIKSFDYIRVDIGKKYFGIVGG